MKTTFRRPAMLLLALAAMVSCAPDSQEPASPFAPQQESAVHIQTTPAAQASWYRITEVLPEPVPVIEQAQIIGLLGGSISVMGHRLDVPALSVTSPTLFTVRVMNNGYIELEMKAVLSSLLGTVNIGEKGFKKPVTVTMTYARATNVSDPQRLKIMRMKDNGEHEIMPTTVNTGAKTISAQLDHFSRYCMISD